MQYAGSLIGRQFKAIAQTNTFHTHDICDPHIFYLWKAIGELTALLWVPEIDDLEQYLVREHFGCYPKLMTVFCLQDDVDIAASNVLDGFTLIDPTKMISKVKLHILGHLRADIRRFGPMVGSASEIFECFNAVFRACSVLSNRQAPSRDIANQLGKQEGFKHRASGGWWKSDNGEWVQAGPGVRHFALHRPSFLERLGWSTHNPAEPGLYCLIYYDALGLTVSCRGGPVGPDKSSERESPKSPPCIMGPNEGSVRDKLCLLPSSTRKSVIYCPTSHCKVI